MRNAAESSTDTVSEKERGQLKSVKKGLRIFVLAFCFLLTVSGMLLGVFGILQHRSYPAAFLVAVLLVGAAFICCGKSDGRLREKLNAQSALTVNISMTALCFAVSLAWVLWFRIEPREDYLTFWTTAKDLASGSRLQLREYVALFPHILGYSSFLSLFLKASGACMLIPAIVNCILTSLTGFLLFHLIQHRFDTASAVLAFSLWIACPSRILYNTMVLSEPYYTFLLFCFFVLIQAFTGREQKIGAAGSILTGLLAGGILALVNTARPIGVIPILALVIWLVFLRIWEGNRERVRTWVLLALTLIICYQVCGMGWKRWEREVLEEEPAGVPGYSMCVGFNLESRGNYSQDDMDQLTAFRYYQGGSAVSAQEAMLQIAKERIAQEKSQIPLLMVYKLKSLLGNDEGGAYYAMEELGRTGYLFASLFSNIFYYFVCCLAVTGLIRLLRGREDSALLVPVLYYIGLVLAQLLVEVSGRYHYSLIPVLVCLAAAAAVNPANKPKTGNLE